MNWNAAESITRRRLIGGIGGALTAIALNPAKAAAVPDDRQQPGDPFIVLLKGIYAPVLAGQGPGDNLGLSSVNLSDGSYARNRIYPIFGIADSKQQDRPIGTFYVQFGGDLCAYDLPGGSLAMRFAPVPPGAPPGFNGFVPFPDGAGGLYLEGTFELAIIEATGIFSAFQGGHNHMVDRLHKLANGSFDEFCFCNVSQYQFP
jgi:hypothetical protein